MSRCRCCLRGEGRALPPPLVDPLRALCHQIEYGDDSTIQVCMICHKFLEDIYVFAKKCVTVDGILRNNVLEDEEEVALLIQTVNGQQMKYESAVSIKEEIDNCKVGSYISKMEREINDSCDEFFHDDMKNLDYSTSDPIEIPLKSADGNQNNEISELLLNCINLNNKAAKNKVKIPSKKLKSIRKKIKTKKKKSLPDNHYSDHLQFDVSNMNDKPYSCNECSYRCSRPSNLKNHKRTHTGEKPFSCKLCDYICSTTSNLKTHTKNKHSSVKPFACEDCDYCAKTKSALLCHKKIHFNVKDYACELCPYKSIQFSKLENHKKMAHTGERPYACDQCPYRSSNSTTLKSHMRSHLSVRKYSCNDCAYTCHTKLSLSNHMCTHTGEKPFQCDVCNFKYINVSSLRRHQRKRHNMVTDTS